MHTAIYVRVSTGGQPTDSQEQELKRYCLQRGWKNPVVYADKIFGAKTSRPELNRLLQDIRGGRVRRPEIVGSSHASKGPNLTTVQNTPLHECPLAAR